MQALIASPLNYTGGKFRLLPQIMPLFPKNIRVFADLFCGGGSVGVNAKAEHVIYNDMSGPVMGLLRLFRDNAEEAILREVRSLIRRYGLSESRERGYAHYGCDSSKGLSAYNREGYMRLRRDYNMSMERSPAMLYVLVAHAFNNQIHFNSRGEYNIPVGKRDFNARMEAKLRAFVRAAQAQDCAMTNTDFRDFDIGGLDGHDFLYADPPYLTGCASYSEHGGWSEADEIDLLDFLDILDKKGVRFALSNALFNKGERNRPLERWLDARPYRVFHLSMSYSNSNYHRRDKGGFTDEALIINYDI